MGVKPVNIVAKTKFCNNFPRSVLLIDIKMFKNLQQNHLSFHLNFEHVDVISMVNKGTYHGKFLSIR